ncbi:Mediator of RNA polymerase II transcription subunit 5 [Drechmeria coniospora]|uniref:Mediator of RNA polymerase II transcription subunit 5 n=1 Tax=Drechmeria coniospora TaxID=98403 RepID=A0A151GI90_DRECN|nr:Mediator of RNA polymerase II transcription subunit 5 [Drechmeria coniospora]KYK56835.1 Mediator of RNA polymerase II transcription subunit 5 [Drechmeria coniospora]
MDSNPLPQSSEALKESMLRWSGFLSRCEAKGITIDDFRAFVKIIYARCPLPPIVIANLFLKPRPPNDISPNPQVPIWFKVLTTLGYVDPPSILLSLYNSSSLHVRLRRPQAEETAERGHSMHCWKMSFWIEEFLFYHVLKVLAEDACFRDSRSVIVLARVMCKWMDLFASASAAFTADVLEETINSEVRDEMYGTREAFVLMLLRFVETDAVVKVLGKPVGKGARKEFFQSLSRFIQTLPPTQAFVDRLEIFRSETLARFNPVDKKAKAATDAAMDELLGATVGLENFVVPEMPISNTRAALYVYLNASLVGRPLIDDSILLSFLHNKYQGETQASAIDLVLASFDLLANAVFRNEGKKDSLLLKSFLVNKVPLLLCQLCSPEFSTTSSEFCITEALNQVDTSIFPTASLMFDESRSNNPYTESVREEFCTACALHGLVPREHVERILGETSMSYEPSLEKYSKDKLLRDCLSDPEKIQGLVKGLDKMDGNVGAMCQALVELLRQLCDSKETMSLKVLCSELAQKPQALDVLLLFEKLPSILEPLCALLDNWRYDDDQGEYQPIYEEFGAILLLVLAFSYRYGLTPADIGITSPESCVARILTRAHISRQADELTEQEKAHIGGWVHGLFDSEAGGLGDDLMSSCPPQEFYLLVASVFQNIVVAYAHGHLSDESLKSGIEYVVDTFLLPSLVPAIQFLSDYLWVEQKEQKSVIKVLQLILLPSAISGEASAMLSSVRIMIAKPLENSLRSYQKQDPKNQDIEPLLRALKDSLPLSRRSGSADHNELELWAGSSSSGLAGAVKHTIQGLVQWSIHHGVSTMPTSYTHRQLVVACRIVGTKRLLRNMLEELRHQSEAGSGHIVYDVVAALICAPDVSNETPAVTSLLDVSGNVAVPQQRRLSLREVLKAEAYDCRKLQKKDAVLAEMVVRLHRRVEALMVVPQPRAILQTQDMSLDLNGGSTSLGDAMAAAAVQADAMAVDGVSLDMGLGGGTGGGLDPTADGDLFGSLDASMDMFGGWDGVDLGST